MATALKTWSNKEFRNVIQFFWAKRVSHIETHLELIEMHIDDGVKRVHHIMK